MEQATIRIKVAKPLPNNEVEEVFVNVFSRPILTGLDTGVLTGDKIFVSPEIFKGLSNAETFDATISGLFIKDIGNPYDFEKELHFSPLPQTENEIRSAWVRNFYANNFYI